MRRRALANVLVAGLLGVVACTTFGSESEEDEPIVPPPGDAAAETATADGATADGGTLADGEAPPALDSGPPADPSSCRSRCNPGTTCTVGDTCLVTTHPTCGAGAPILVDQPGRYLGRICKLDGSKQSEHCGEQRYVHVFQITGTMSSVTVRPVVGSNLQFSVDPTCGAGTCQQVLSVNGGGVSSNLSTNDFLTIGVPLCGNYELVCTK